VPHDGEKSMFVGVASGSMGRSVAICFDLQELQHLGVAFVSLTEALDLTTPAGRAMAGLLVFAEFERKSYASASGWSGSRTPARQTAWRPRLCHTPPTSKAIPEGVSKSEMLAGFRSAEPRSAPCPKEILIQAALRSPAGRTQCKHLSIGFCQLLAT